MSGRLGQKVIIITGTGGSMGNAAARMFSAQGAKIVGCDVNVARAEETLAQVRAAGGEMVSLHPCDLTESANCERLAELALSTFGGVDVLYNNAAMAYLEWFDKISERDFKATIDEELTLVFLMCRAVWPHFIKRGGASIINVASVNAKRAQRGLPGIAHSAAKAGVLAMTRQLAMEGGPHKIRANTISPGFVATHQTRPFVENAEAFAVLKDTIILGRAGKPEDIASAALFLASDESAWITGADFAIDGGMTAWR
jgi:NAD(P)-dependent dehydrogenase (short-subunit alcohol dehydrogenase family)